MINRKSGSVVCLLFLSFSEHSDQFDRCWPLMDYTDILSVIKKNFDEICTNVDTDHDLIGELLKQKCITYEQMDSLKSMKSLPERNMKLLDIITRCSIEKFYLFLQSVDKTQPHLLPLFTGDTGNQGILNTLNCPLRLLKSLFHI
jgi:hypothetical protein